MTLKSDIQELARTVPEFREILTSEQATKQALVVPFIKALGYNVYDPREVVPEYDADYGVKHGEKVDYAIMKDGVPVILIECKRLKDKLNGDTVKSQLFRYFVATSEVRLGVLTNGVKYQFFSDLDNQNVMDVTPFLEIDLENLTDGDVEHLGRFAKGFDVKTTVQEAARIRQIDLIRALMSRQMLEPEPKFLDWVREELYPDDAPVPLQAKFPDMVKDAMWDFVNGKIHETLRVAQSLTQADKDHDTSEADESHDNIHNLKCLSNYIPPAGQKVEIVESIGLLKDMLKDVIDLDRVQVKCGTSGYIAVMRDRSQWTGPICRVWFNNNGKNGLAYFDGSRNRRSRPLPVEVAISQPADILQYREQLQYVATLQWSK